MSLRTIPAEVVRIVARHGAPFKELHFGEGVFGSSLEEGGGVTIRRGRKDFGPGNLVIAVCAEGGRFLLQIVSCDQRLLCRVPRQDILDYGFASHYDALQGLRRFYPALGFTSTVTVIRFEVAAEVVEDGEDVVEVTISPS